jgi:8-oxo-(d)GTP phosphatase
LTRVERFVLLRHSNAGEKFLDPAKDFGRGLAEDGERIAQLLPEVLAEHLRPVEILSSPLRRCVQTVQPLAAALGLQVQEDERLAPQGVSTDPDRTLRHVRADAVACTHRELFEQLFDDVRCAKGAFWIIERNQGRLSPVQYVDVAARLASGWVPGG